MKVFDISLPIYNNMWAYRDEWKNEVSFISQTKKGGASTVYRFNLVSHTGTYIETSQHKLKNNKLLNVLPLDCFVKETLLVNVKVNSQNCITKAAVIKALRSKRMVLKKSAYIIIATGYGKNYSKKDYLSASPYFEEELTDWLIEKEIGLIGTDTPIIENLKEPYTPVIKMFKANQNLLLLAPLLINPKVTTSGKYLLNCLPLPIKEVSGSLCRAVLMK